MIKIKFKSKDPDEEDSYIKLTELQVNVLSNMLWEFYYDNHKYYG